VLKVLLNPKQKKTRAEFSQLPISWIRIVINNKIKSLVAMVTYSTPPKISSKVVDHVFQTDTQTQHVIFLADVTREGYRKQIARQHSWSTVLKKISSPVI